MSRTEPPTDAPSAAALSPFFEVTEVRTDGEAVRYVGFPLVRISALESELAPLFHEQGYEIRITGQLANGGGEAGPEYAVVAEPQTVGIDGIPWKNIALALATIATTLYAGTVWYYIDLSGNPLNILEAWPFSLAILTILGVHEGGHYVMSRVHKVKASLPYFIPIPPPFGTAGAIIRMRGRIPDRKALLDIGASGPLAGMVATIVVTTIGLFLDPVTVPQEVLNSNAGAIQFNNPPLLELLAWLTGQPLSYADPTKQLNPIVFAGWLGMLVTFLNLLPVGQLDGGHIMRALLGPRAESVAAVIPGTLFSMAGVLFLLGDVSFEVGIWVVWGVFTSVMVFVGPADPMQEGSLDRKRQFFGVLAFVVGILCFMPIPFEIIPPA